MKRTGFKRKPANTLDQTPAQKRISKTWPVEHMKESQFQTHVEKTAHQFGWMTSHSHLPYFDTAGWPDLAMVHPVKAKFMVRELKATNEAGKVPQPSPKQWEWIYALIGAGIDASVWTWPQDADRLIEELKA